jgi:hypothetical protein
MIFIARASRVAPEGVEHARRFIFARIVVVVVVVARARARAGADAIEIVIADILGAPARRPLDGSRANEWRATGFPSPSRRRPRRTPRRTRGRRPRDDATTTGDAR